MLKSAFLTKPIDTVAMAAIEALDLNLLISKWQHFDVDMAAQLRASGRQLHVEVGLFVGEDWWQRFPDARPLDRAGQPLPPINWYHGVCPNHPAVRVELLDRIAQIIETMSIDGLWLDFIRYPAHWEIVRDEAPVEYCFCDHCLAKYQREVGGELAGPAWIAWKCRQIADLVAAVRALIDASSQPIQLGLFAVPWQTNELDGAIRRVIGQDFRLLANWVDLFGPMLYHGLADRSLNWLPTVTQHLHQLTKKPILPLIQTMDEPRPIRPEEFATALAAATATPAAGVCLFHLAALQDDKLKFANAQQFFS